MKEQFNHLKTLMPRRLLTAIRLLMLPAFAFAGLMTYSFGLEFFGSVIPIPEDKSFIFATLLAQGFAVAVLVSILFCYPLAFIYRKFASTAALMMALLVLALRLPELLEFDRHPIALAISAYEVFAYAALLVVGAGLANDHIIRFRIRHNHGEQ